MYIDFLVSLYLIVFWTTLLLWLPHALWNVLQFSQFHNEKNMLPQFLLALLSLLFFSQAHAQSISTLVVTNAGIPTTYIVAGSGTSSGSSLVPTPTATGTSGIAARITVAGTATATAQPDRVRKIEAKNVREFSNMSMLFPGFMRSIASEFSTGVH